MNEHPVSTVLLPSKVTDEANQMSQLAGAKRQGEDKVRVRQPQLLRSPSFTSRGSSEHIYSVSIQYLPPDYSRTLLRVAKVLM